MPIDLSWMLEPKVLLGGAWSALLVIVGGVLVMVRGRMRVLQYTVTHVPVAISAKDDVFGHIEVTLSGKTMERLWMSTVTLKNDTGKDFEALPVRVYTNDDTLLLGERTEVLGTTFRITHSPEMIKKLALAPGAKPTTEQQRIFNHERDYIVPVLNRGDSAKWSMLTSVPPTQQGQTQIVGPSVWCDLLKQGVKVRHRFIGPEVLGVPTKRAVWLGFIATVTVYGVSVYLLVDPWAVAIPSAVVGFFAPFVGAYLYKAFRFVLPMVVQ